MNRYSIILNKNSSDSTPVRGSFLEQFGINFNIESPSRVQFFRGKKYETYRIGFLYETDSGLPFICENVHFYKKYFLCKKGECCENFPSRERGCAIIALLNDNNIFSVNDLRYWVFSNSVINKLVAFRNNFGPSIFRDREFNITCTLEDFQQWDITPLRETFWRNSFSEELIQEVPLLLRRIKFGLDLNLNEMTELCKEYKSICG